MGENFWKKIHTCKFRFYQFMRAYEQQKIPIARLAQHHVRGGNTTTLSFKGLARTRTTYILPSCAM